MTMSLSRAHLVPSRFDTSGITSSSLAHLSAVLLYDVGLQVKRTPKDDKLARGAWTVRTWVVRIVKVRFLKN
jgi:hypothetical protein